ncbi:hypothetical protein SUGI_0881760 [Cryptomeria japonica]|nr:hypothetical protein SUGI_0881760 [Cryptomeria japonica]
MEESKEFFSAFEVVAALAWQARTKARQILNDQNVKLLFPMDIRRLINPPLPQGYYGNAIGMACALDTAQDLINGSILQAAKIIKKSKLSLNDTYLMPSIVTYPSTLNITTKQDNLLALGDWRWLGFNEVDFGWGDAENVSSLLLLEKELAPTDYIIFVQPPKHMPNGIKMVMCMPMSIFKSFKIEVDSIINQYM